MTLETNSCIQSPGKAVDCSRQQIFNADDMNQSTRSELAEILEGWSIQLGLAGAGYSTIFSERSVRGVSTGVKSGSKKSEVSYKLGSNCKGALIRTLRRAFVKASATPELSVQDVPWNRPPHILTGGKVNAPQTSFLVS